jgi:two-component system, sensor histidine kinase and response regulator
MTFRRFVIVSLLVLSGSRVWAQLSIDALWKRINSPSDTIGLMKAYVSLLNHYQDSSLDTVQLITTRLTGLAREAGSKKHEYIATASLAFALYDNAEYAKAIDQFEKALELQQQLGGKEVASIYNDIGRAYRRMGDHKKALELFFKSIELAQIQKDTGLEATVYNNLAIVVSSEGNDSLALDYHYKSLNLHTQIKDSAGIVLAYSNLGETFLTLDRVEEAKENYKKALEISQASKNKRYLGYSYVNLGSLSLYEKRYQSAVDYFDRALTIFNTVHVTVYSAECKLGLSEGYAGLGNYNKARSLAEESLHAGELIQSPDLIISAADQLSSICKSQGDFKNALIYLEKANATRDQLKQKQNQNAFENYNARFELEKKKLEIASLEKDLKLNMAQEQQQRIINYALIIGALLLLLIAVGLLVAFQQKQKSNKLLLQSQRTIKTQNLELKQLSVVKDKLLSIAAHDFRGPLASINGLIPLLRGKYIEEAEREEVLDSLAQQLNSTTYFLENLLQWSRNQFTKLAPKIEQVEAALLIAECIQLLEKGAKAKKIELKNNVLSQLVWADIEMTRFIFRNLISNAIKFTHEGGTVIIDAKQVKGFCQFGITDNGIGISPQQVNQLFKLETAVTAGTRNERGTGLGLALCKDFVTIMGGEIGVESQAGKGATFWVTLPTHT